MMARRHKGTKVRMSTFDRVVAVVPYVVVTLLCLLILLPYLNVVLGDLNDDGLVTVTDATIFVNALLNGTEAGLPSANADLNGDGFINITDAIELINILLNSH